MNRYTFFKHIMLLWIIFNNAQVTSTVKVFVNDSSKHFIVQVYDHNKNIVTTYLKPGAIQELFIEGNIIDKIMIQDQNYAKKSFGGLTCQILRKETMKINDHMIFIIHQNGSVKMYKSATSKDDVLKKIDTFYTQKSKLPTIDISIHTKKADRLSTEQEIIYSIN